MGVSKVELKNTDGTTNVLVDLTGDTVTADTLAEGATAHGADGEEIIGTMQAGIDTSDATATASDLVSGKTAYVNGEKITGKIMERVKNVGTEYGSMNTSFGDVGHRTTTVDDVKYRGLQVTFLKDIDKIYRRGSFIGLYVPASDYGDATEADVAEGKTFTSASGRLLTGTASGTAVESDDNCEAYHITDKSTALDFKRTDGDIKVWGYGYYSASTYSKTTYAFVGDGYYTALSYGTPSKTSATFSIGSDGTLSGLPSNLTTVDLIVTKGV